MRRKDILNEIRQLDPVKAHQRIVFLTANYEFPWDTTRSLELALFRTFAVAKGTSVLAGTGEFTQRPQKRSGTAAPQFGQRATGAEALGAGSLIARRGARSR